MSGELPPGPKLWDKHPGSVVHIAGGQLMIFNRFFRQRCDWCGYILVEGDLARIQVRVEDLPYEPAMWTVGSLVRVDGVMSADVEPVVDEGQTKLPPDSCCFDPLSQVGADFNTKDWDEFRRRLVQG